MYAMSPLRNAGVFEALPTAFVHDVSPRSAWRSQYLEDGGPQSKVKQLASEMSTRRAATDVRPGRLLQNRKHRPDHLAQCERAQCNGNGQNNLLKGGHECPLPWRLLGLDTTQAETARLALSC